MNFFLESEEPTEARDITQLGNAVGSSNVALERQMRAPFRPPHGLACGSAGALLARGGESRVHVTVRVRTIPDRALPRK
jgi:hypothetical protein